jgi:hypothetical protein
MTMSQMRDLLEEVFVRYPKMKENYINSLIDFPKSSYDLPKSHLLIKLISNSTKFDRIVLKNNLLNFVKDDSVVAFDGITFMETINERMSILDLFNVAISIVGFSLGLF